MGLGRDVEDDERVLLTVGNIFFFFLLLGIVRFASLIDDLLGSLYFLQL